MSGARRLCFIIEEKYRRESMPLAVVSQRRRWGYDVDLLERHATVTPLVDLVAQRDDAYVLKTASGSPGLSLLEAVEAAGIPTIKNARSISLVRDKAVAIAMARTPCPSPQVLCRSSPTARTDSPGPRRFSMCGGREMVHVRWFVGLAKEDGRLWQLLSVVTTMRGAWVISFRSGHRTMVLRRACTS